MRTPGQLSASSSSSSIEVRHSKEEQRQLVESPPTQQEMSPGSLGTAVRDRFESSSQLERVASLSVSQSAAQRKRSSRSRTTLHFAQPAPRVGARQLLQFKPKLVLQLHRASTTSRPEPALDVLTGIRRPTTPRNVAQVLGKGKLTTHDLVVVKAEAYGLSEDAERWDSREVLGIIRPSGQDEATSGKAEICLPDGSSWKATSLPAGRYDFASTDEHNITQTVRWVPAKRRISSGRSSRCTNDERKLNFSIINPSSRRHPVVASMTCNGVDLFDEYRIPCAQSASTATTPVPESEEAASYIDSVKVEEEDQSPLIETDEDLRRLIVLTSIWVAFREQWCGSKLSRSPSSSGNVKRGSSVRERPRRENTSDRSTNARKGAGHVRTVSMPLSFDGSGGLLDGGMRKLAIDSVAPSASGDGPTPDGGARGKSKFSGLRRTLSIFKRDRGG